MTSYDANSNPFLVLQHTLRNAVYLSHGPFFSLQLYGLCAVQGLSLLLVIGALSVRRICGVFWIARVHRTQYGSWIIPNPVCCWLIWSGIFLGALLRFTTLTLVYGKNGSDLKNVMLWRCLVWIPLWLAGWLMSFSTWISPLLSQEPSAATFSLSHFPRTATFILFLLPSLLLGSVIPLSIITSNAFNKMFAIFLLLDEGLTEAANAVQSGQVVQDGDALSGLGAEFPARLLEVVTWWRRVWMVWAGFAGFLFL